MESNKATGFKKRLCNRYLSCEVVQPSSSSSTLSSSGGSAAKFEHVDVGSARGHRDNANIGTAASSSQSSRKTQPPWRLLPPSAPFPPGPNPALSVPVSLPSASPAPAASRWLCSICGRSFQRSDMLRRHARSHTGRRPYMCEECGQAFSRSDHLATHKRKHTGEKPFACYVCGYAASRADMITRHARALHGEPNGGSSGRIGSSASGVSLQNRNDDSDTISPPSRKLRRHSSGNAEADFSNSQQ